MEQYEFEGIIYNVAPNRLEEFKNQFPDATLVEESLEKTNGSQIEDATAEPVDTASKSEDGLLEQPETETKLWGGLVPITKEKAKSNEFRKDGGFFEDLVLSAKQGMASGTSVEEAYDVYKQGKEISDEQLQGFIDASNAMNELGETDEQIQFRKSQEQEGGGLWGTMKALADNPGFFPQMIVSSFATMATSLESGEVRASTAVGAGAGTFVPIVGTMTGGLTGLIGSMETALTMTDLIKEELGEKDFNKENVREILEDEELFNKIRLRAVGRGFTIGAIEGVTMGISRGVGSKILATSDAGRFAKSLKISGATTGVETTGAFIGETAGQAVAGQDIDLGQSFLEGVGEVRSVVNTSDIVVKALKKPEYKINGEVRTKKDVQDILDNKDLTVEELSKIRFDVKNDDAFLNNIEQVLSDAIAESQINEKVTDEADRKTLVDLNKKYNKAKADTEKKGIFAVPGAKKAQEDIEMQINDIIGKYEAVDGRTKEVRDIKKTAKVVQENVADKIFKSNLDFAKKHSRLFNLTVEDNLTSDQIKEQYGEEASESLGFIKDDKIIINSDVAKKRVNGRNVGNHELLHGIINVKWKNLEADQKTKLANELLESIGEKNKSIVNERVSENYSEAYMKDNPDEYITIISDGIANGQIKFDDNIFTKVKDYARNLFQSLGFANVDFETSQGVYNFLKDYNRSIHKGALKSSVAKAVSGEGAVDGIKFSKEASDRVQQIYQDQGLGGAMDIIDQFAPIVNRLVQRRSEAPNFDRQLLTDEINTGERGIFDLIQSYKPESGVPLAAYINKFLPARAIEASRRVLGEEFTEDVTEARGIEAEETIEQQPERRTKLKVLADQLNVADKVKSEVAEANIDPNTLTNFKSVPNAATNTVGELLGISPSKIKSKANLTAAEVASAQRWFNKNARLVIDALPQGFDTEGQATGVPRTVLDALYTKREARAKTKAGLRTQVKRPNIKDSELLELVDIVDGKPTRNRNTSARIIALSDLLGKVMTNQEVRQTVPGTERIRSGMSDIMFSKSAQKIINIKSLFELETKGVDKLLKVYEVDKTFNLRSLEGRENFIKSIEQDLLPLMPRDFWFGPDSTVFTASNKTYGLSMSRYKKGDKIPKGKKIGDYKKPEEAEAYNNLRTRIKALKALPDNKFGKPIKGVEDYSLSAYSTIFKDEAAIKKNLQNGKIEGWNKKVALIHKEMWSRFNKAINKDDKVNSKTAAAIGTYLKLVGSDTGHWHKLGAQFVGYSKKITGARFEYEHAMPATSAYLYLLDAALSNADFNTAYDLVIDNYKLIALDKAMDKKLTAVGLQRRMPVGWDLIENNWWDRYFNKTVGKIDGGIDPASIISLDGKSFDQTYNVNVEGASAITLPVEDKASISESISNVRPVLKYSKESRGMSTFDFDETLIIDGENFVTATKGEDVVKIPSDKWPIDGPKLAAEGYKFDFSDFANVRGGKEGPLLQKMKNQIKKYGPNNVFVLTARQQEAAEPIHKWLKSQGISIPIENITGLGKSEGDAKAQWFVDKYAEGYNDMYFVDDALPNVEAVKHVFDQLDVKGKSVQARIQFSKDMSSEFNKMLERTKGVAAEKRFSRVVGQKRGKNIGRYRFFVPPSAEDFAGLLYDFYGKGKQGDADMEFMKKALLDPFGRADREMSMARMSILDDYKMLRKELPEVKKKLGKIIDKDTGFTFDNAVRAYLFDKAGFEIPGVSKRDLDYLKNIVNTDQDLKTFADTLSIISKRKEGWIKPGENWSVETIASDLENIVNKIGRKKYLAEFIENKNIIFSPENMNKIEAVYGSRFRSALEDSLYRMENGTNRSAGRSYGQTWTNWVNGSVGAIMFFNARSAVLQTLSTVNFINFQDNNIFKAGKAFANQKQYWSDFTTLFNSDFLKARRAGLQINVNEAELANAVAGAQNRAKAALAYLLKKGFLPTQAADSFAIASGGATFYRNRIETYVKDGFSQKVAEEKAFLDFQEIAQETQQSARPDRISQQQASPLGRLILAFANTPMQYNRLIKKAARDLINNRGDWRSNISRILYYGAIQNVIFSALQSAIFALSFDDEEDDELDKRTMRVANTMIDTILRGSGVTGAAVATIKNTIMRFIEESERESRADYGQVVVEALQVSPPMGSKARKLYSALNAYKFNREIMGSMDTFDYNNPIWDAIGNVTTAATNVPLDRLFRKTDNIKEAFNQENSAMQRTFLLLGWSSWDLQVGERVVVNKGKKNEYVKYLDTKRQAQEEAKEELKETKKKEKRARQRRCTGIKSDGTQCAIMVTKPKTRCHYHD